MKALVTGATGFIGSSIVRELLKDGIEVKVLVRKESNTKNIDGLDVEKTYGDIRDKESMKEALKGCNILYQTAAFFTFWARENKTFDDINIAGTTATLSAALEQGVDKVVYTSSVATIGYEESGKLANEMTEFNMWKGSHYTRTKLLGELEARKFYEQGLPVVIVNPATVLGIRDIRPTPSGDLIVTILNGNMPGYPDGGFNLVDVEDVARGHVLAAEKGRIGERYILGNTNMTMKDFFSLIAEVGGVTVPNRKISYPMAMAMSYLFKIISIINRKPPLFTESTARCVGRYLYYDCSKADKELGIPHTPIKTTIEKAVNWFRDNGYVKAESKT